MGLLKSLLSVSVPFGLLNSGTPESVAITSPSTNEQLLGYFSGWTAKFTLNAGNLEASEISGLAPLTVFSASENKVTCAWVKDQVQAYSQADDVFDELFLQSKPPSLSM